MTANWLSMVGAEALPSEQNRRPSSTKETEVAFLLGWAVASGAASGGALGTAIIRAGDLRPSLALCAISLLVSVHSGNRSAKGEARASSIALFASSMRPTSQNSTA